MIVSGKVLGVAVVSLLQVVLLTVVALLFGWQGNFGLGVVVFAVGVVAFGAMGLLMGGTLSSELVLGLANLIWFALVGVASYLIFVAPEVPRAMELIPSVALSQGLVYAFDGVFPAFEILILMGWAAAAAVAAIKWFKFA